MNKKNNRDHRGTLRKIMIYFGGSDLRNYTSKSILLLRQLDWPGLKILVFTGTANPWNSQIQDLAVDNTNIEYFCNVKNISAYMTRADLIICSGGFIMYEMAYMGLPGVILPLSDIQEKVASEIDALEAGINLGITGEYPAEQVINVLTELYNAPERCKSMSQKGQLLLDGQGSGRIADAIVGRIAAHNA